MADVDPMADAYLMVDSPSWTTSGPAWEFGTSGRAWGFGRRGVAWGFGRAADMIGVVGEHNSDPSYS